MVEGKILAMLGPLKKLTHTLPETNMANAPEKKAVCPKRKRSSSNHPFSAKMLVSGRVKINKLPSGQDSNGISPFLTGNTSSKGPFSIAIYVRLPECA